MSPESRDDRRWLFRQESNVSAQGLEEHVQVPSQIVELVLRRARRGMRGVV
jgi:hypothetical protein